MGENQFPLEVEVRHIELDNTTNLAHQGFMV